MKHLVCMLIAAAALVGCRGSSKTETQPAVSPIPAGNFAQQWFNPLRLPGDSVDALHLRDDTLFVYTNDNLVYGIARSGGELKYIAEPDVSGGVLRAPLLLGENVIFPCG